MPPDNNSFDADERPGPRVLQAMWQFRAMSVAILVMFTALSGLVGKYLAAPPTATATMALKTPRQTNVLSPGLQGDASLARYTAQRARFIKSDAVMSAVSEQVGEPDKAAIRSGITAEPATTSNVINVSVTGPTPEKAVERAAAVLDAYRSQTLEQVEALSNSAITSINDSQTQIREQLAASPAATVDAATAATLSQLQLQAAEIETSSALLGDGVEFVVAPTLESVKVSKIPLRELALGFLVGVMIAASAAWIRAESMLSPPGVGASGREADLADENQMSSHEEANRKAPQSDTDSDVAPRRQGRPSSPPSNGGPRPRPKKQVSKQDVIESVNG